ncbi:hypothetical protein [Methylomonas sp. CM2]|uniref:hypothetical protein n=1 Tax=Methylomonas sp. CM2 TaxID=3417647 RepID=UPI003CEE9571
MNTEKNEVLTALTKGVIGMVPVIGPIVAEIVGVLVPNQRIQRIELLLKKLESKLEHLDTETIKGLMTAPEAIDLMEDGFLQASKAISEERKEYIASLLKNGLTDKTLQHIEYKRLISILGELNDLEVIILKSHLLHPSFPESAEFWEKHEKALTPPLAHLGSSQEEIDKETIYKSHNIHLTNLGLIKPRFSKPRKGELPDFDDKTGMMKASGYNITNLGDLLLRSIDQVGP